MTLYLTRLRKRREPALAAVRMLLDPDDDAARMDADHRLIWSAFSEGPDASRDFLWRTEGRRDLLVLSHRAPVPSPFFEPPQTRPFAPDLRAGDQLGFALRANATKTVAPDPSDLAPSGQPRRKHRDLVMDALHGVPASARAGKRSDLAQEVAQGWLAAQGSRSGFSLLEAFVEDYSVLSLPRQPRKPHKGKPRFGVLDLAGRLEVTDPAAFLDRLARGYGRGKAFGCGLMLIRRA